MSKRERDARKYARKVKKLAQKCSLNNDQCADCGASRPSWVTITFGTFLCMRCANIHRRLSGGVSTVKSVELDKFNEQTYKSIKSKGGNKKLNKIYEASALGFNASMRPSRKADQFKMQQFINLKYNERRWYYPQAVKEEKVKRKKQKKQEESEEEDEDEDEDEDESEQDVCATVQPVVQLQQPSTVIHRPTTTVPNASTVNNGVMGNLLDLSQMEQAQQWHQSVNPLDDQKDGELIINGLTDANASTSASQQQKPNEILQRYRMQQLQQQQLQQSNALLNNLTPQQMKHQLQQMQMRLKQMEMKLSTQNIENKPAIETVDDWADFGDTDNTTTAPNTAPQTNFDDDWGDFNAATT